MRLVILLSVLLGLSSIARFGSADEPVAKLLNRFDAAEAHQAVAVDHNHFYAIANQKIGKYEKRSGKFICDWTSRLDVPLNHLNSGVIVDGRLYCAHSNYPLLPETSSVEIFDAVTLQHVGTHSFGITEGSLTWIDRYNGAWWAVFAHYSKLSKINPRAKPTMYTSLVQFDLEWRRLAGWTFPVELLAKFGEHSCSGGGWGPDGELYCTGHDLGELYQLKIPRAGSTLILVDTIPLEITGQGIAWDKAIPGAVYGIDRSKRQVVVSTIPLAPIQPRD